MALPDVTDTAFEWAADRLLRESGRTFFPTPNELRAHLTAQRVPPGRRLAGPLDAVDRAYANTSACPACGGRKGIHRETCGRAITEAARVAEEQPS